MPHSHLTCSYLLILLPFLTLQTICFIQYLPLGSFSRDSPWDWKCNLMVKYLSHILERSLFSSLATRAALSHALCVLFSPFLCVSYSFTISLSHSFSLFLIYLRSFFVIRLQLSQLVYVTNNLLASSSFSTFLAQAKKGASKLFFIPHCIIKQSNFSLTSHASSAKVLFAPLCFQLLVFLNYFF